MQKSIAFSLAVILTSIVSMSAPAHAETLKFEGKKWVINEYEGSAARVENFLGRKALFLQQTVALLEGDNLRDVVIEYEYASTHPSGFIGVNFRADLEASNLEQFYTRPHQSGHPDATQYMVMINGSATWQLHAGPNDAVATDLPSREWIKVRIVAIGDRADIFVGDMTKPLMHVPDLRHDGGEGRFSLYASDRPWMTETGAYFSNITVRPATKNDAIIGEPNESDPTPEGLLTQFEVSKPFAEKTLANKYSLDGLDVLSDKWTLLAVENDGVANLARTTPLKPEANTVLVKFRVASEEDTNRLLKFGYSDRIHLFVDGALVYAGNAQWRARDHRFLGTIALADSVALNLKAGETEIVAAISESFGGWGFKAQLQDQDGLEISPH
ncbi:MAG: hypothetical protein DHS20C05_00800 [Hyphococcus sp.]|nr:MAG: hypothetical protein DHS20C05_00800 [Marinicaulis sp.]